MENDLDHNRSRNIDSQKDQHNLRPGFQVSSCRQVRVLSTKGINAVSNDYQQSGKGGNACSFFLI
jgi:hypothetical protein